MTVASGADERAQQARWSDWVIAGARSERRRRTKARVIAVIVFTVVAANVLIRLLASLRTA